MATNPTEPLLPPALREMFEFINAENERNRQLVRTELKWAGALLSAVVIIFGFVGWRTISSVVRAETARLTAEKFQSPDMQQTMKEDAVTAVRAKTTEAIRQEIGTELRRQQPFILDTIRSETKHQVTDRRSPSIAFASQKQVTFKHGLNTKTPVVECFDLNGEAFFWNSVRVVDLNTVVVTGFVEKSGNCGAR